MVSVPAQPIQFATLPNAVKHYCDGTKYNGQPCNRVLLIANSREEYVALKGFELPPCKQCGKVAKF